MTPDPHFTAGAIRFAALMWAEHGADPQRRFAPTLDQWAANAERRAMPDQPDLFQEDAR